MTTWIKTAKEQKHSPTNGKVSSPPFLVNSIPQVSMCTSSNSLPRLRYIFLPISLSMPESKNIRLMRELNQLKLIILIGPLVRLWPSLVLTIRDIIYGSVGKMWSGEPSRRGTSILSIRRLKNSSILLISSVSKLQAVEKSNSSIAH